MFIEAPRGEAHPSGGDVNKVWCSKQSSPIGGRCEQSLFVEAARGEAVHSGGVAKRRSPFGGRSEAELERDQHRHPRMHELTYIVGALP